MNNTGKIKNLDFSKLSREQKLKKLAEIEKLEEEIAKKLEEAKDQDPFYYFEPSTGEITGEGLELMQKYLKPDDIPQRLDSQSDAICDQSDIIGASGGNQSGKSTSLAIWAYIWTIGDIPYSLEGIYPKERLSLDRNRNGRIVGVDNKQLMNTVIPTFQKWVPRKYLKDGKWKASFSSEQRKLFLYKPGTDVLLATIEFRTNEQDVDSFQGPPLGFVGYDEEPKEAIHKENVMRFVTSDKLNFMFAFTPTHGLSWATDLFDDEETDNGETVSLHKLVSTCNPKANIKVLDSILAHMTSYEEIKMRLLGEFVSLSGLVYGKLFDKRIHVIPPFYESLAPSHQREHLCLGGMDPHLVTSTAGVFCLLDREDNLYVDLCYFKDSDTQELKDDFAAIRKDNNYRMGWSVADKSSDSTITAFGGRNIFREISRGKNAIPALRTSEKFEGSIRIGVDEIKKRLKVDERTGKPRFFIVDRPENKMLIDSFRTLERDTYANEADKGKKDRIKEGKHHLHASLRYIFQFPLHWYPEVDYVPQPTMYDEDCCW